MPPKRKAAPKKKKESPPPSESEPESEPEYSSEEEEPESPQPKKTKAAAKPKAPLNKKKAAPAPSPKKAKAPAAQKKQPAKKGGKAEVVAEKPAPDLSPEKEKESAPKVGSKQVVIEHCKQCQSFKRTATKLEQLLKKSIPDLKVTLNPDKPRKGIFEVRDEEGNIFVSLQGLVRPFQKMKDLDLEETAGDVASKLT